MSSLGIKAGVVFVLSFFFLGLVSAQAAETTSPIYESEVKELVVYEGNLSLVEDMVEVHSADVIQVSLPHGLVTRTLEIVDGNEKVGEFSYVQPEKSVATTTAISEPRRQIIKWESGLKESRQVNLRYLLSGISWEPSYVMNILSDDKVQLTYRVAISNNVGLLSKVKVKLISGMVGEVSEAYPRVVAMRKSMTAAQSALRSGAMDSFSAAEIISLPTIGATRINAYYVYDLEQVDSLERGTNYITLLDQDFGAEKKFVWLTTEGENVDVIYKVKNSSEQPFAAGIVDTYEDGVYMGSDNIEWTPSGSEGHVTIGGSVDIKVKKLVNITEIPERNHNDEYHHKVELEIKNFSNKDINIKVIENKYPDCVDIAFSLKPEEEGQKYVWEIDIQAGQTRKIKYDFYSDSTYYDVYRAYR